MRNLIYAMFVCALFAVVSTEAQTMPSPSPTPNAATEMSKTATADAKPKRRNFRSNKEQIAQAQKMLKVAESGKSDAETKAAVKTYQGENGLKKSGSLNRATLEKMGIELTDAQKEIPVSESSFAAAKSDSAGTETKKRGPVFRANKEQIMETQRKLKTGAMYAGEETGKLDDATRDGIRKFQTANGVKVTGTLNKETLEKMGIVLTDKQKEM